MAEVTKRWMLGALSAVGIVMPLQDSRAATAQTSAFDDPAAQPLEEVLKSFPFEIVTVDGAKALEEWTHLRTAGRGWPVVIGDDESLRDTVEMFTGAPANTQPSTPHILKAAEAIIVPKDIKAWQEADGNGELDAPIGKWPTKVASSNLPLGAAIDILTGKPLTAAHIVLIPTSHGWEVPAYLRWGGWNSCPPPAHQMAILRSWHDRFGAELAGLSADYMNLQIARPVTQKDEAMVLAEEQYAYCPDLVDQGAGDITTLAASLIGQKWWDFWWD